MLFCQAWHGLHFIFLIFENREEYLIKKKKKNVYNNSSREKSMKE